MLWVRGASARAVYAMAFEKPFVAGITWYIVLDDPWLAGAGLIPGPEWPPRLVYQAIGEVIEERTTTGTVGIDSAGIATIEGYAGDYRLEINDGTRTTVRHVHITEEEDDSVLLQPMPAATSAAIVLCAAILVLLTARIERHCNQTALQ